MLTNASKYAIRAVLYLAQNSSVGNKYSSKDIAKNLEIPTHFIAKLLQPLAKKNIISSSKGPTGGFYFTKNNGKKNVCDIIELIEGQNVFTDCFMGLPRCGDDNPCPIHHIVAPFKKELLDSFMHKTLTQFAKEIDDNDRFLSLLNVDS